MDLMSKPRISVSSPSVLPLMLYRDKGFQAALGLTLEQPRIRIGEGRILSEGDPGLLGRELMIISSIIAEMLREEEIVPVYEAARRGGLKGWRGSLAAAGFAYGGLIMTAGKPGELQPVISRFHLPSTMRVVVADLPCRPPGRRGIKVIMKALSRASMKDLKGFLGTLREVENARLAKCGVLKGLLEELGDNAVAGASPTGLLYVMGGELDMCRLGEILLGLGVVGGSIITNPQNYGARVEAFVQP